LAIRWRISHKLIFAFCLTAGIIILLLGGTLQGLWSYYLTMNSIRGNVAELKTAEELKTALAKMAVPGDLGKLLDDPEKLHRDITQALQKILEYEVFLRDSQSFLVMKNEDAHEKEVLAGLRSDLNAFQTLAEKFHEPRVTGPSDKLSQNPIIEPLRILITKMEKESTMLRDKIHNDLDHSINDSRRHYQISLWIIVPSSAFGLLLMAGLLHSFYGWIFYPIRDLEAGVSLLARGDFNHRIEVKSGDEMESLAQAFNEMTRRLRELYTDLARQVNERSRQLVRSERLASVGFLAAGVAHEINNPIAGIAFCAEALESRLKELTLLANKSSGQQNHPCIVDFARYLKLIQEEAFRCKNITEKLLDFSRTTEHKREAVSLPILVQSVLDVTAHLQNSKGKKIEIKEEQPTKAWINAEEIKSVILNLVVNGLDSMDDGGMLTIIIREKDGQAELAIKDTGIGMNQEVLENIFEPFYTQNRTGKGTGLGLTISHKIIQQHGGDIEATSEGLGQGSVFTIRLPLHPIVSTKINESMRRDGVSSGQPLALSA
jgi:two-component system, NtrC family, sensor kinase